MRITRTEKWRRRVRRALLLSSRHQGKTLTESILRLMKSAYQQGLDDAETPKVTGP